MKRKPNKVPKSRNPFVAAARFRVAGAHDKPNKVKRRELKQELKAALGYSRIGLSNKY
jgi:hypothetical protein